MTIPPLQIDWYSGSTQYEQPRRLRLGGCWLEVLRVERRGRSPEGAFFCLVAANHRRYRLDYDRRSDVWRCTPCG